MFMIDPIMKNREQKISIAIKGSILWINKTIRKIKTRRKLTQLKDKISNIKKIAKKAPLK
jgi:hypothetical protein